ncbi:MAG TPA: hypothetical protein VHB79_10775 [Polyangiaceae bacterium]|nr:hypothetical protein [Polyangiaceae bacterium]
MAAELTREVCAAAAAESRLAAAVLAAPPASGEHERALDLIQAVAEGLALGHMAARLRELQRQAARP